MKKIFVLLLVCTALFSCKKKNTTIGNTDATPITSEQILSSFANDLAIPNYTKIFNHATALHQAVVNFQTTKTDANLKLVQDNWRLTRESWELCEAYLLGPVEDFSYDPQMDTWPIDKNGIDSLLISSNNLTLTDVDALAESLKGFHAIEYMIFGIGGNKKASQVTNREMKYLLSITESLKNTTMALMNGWVLNPSTNFKYELTNVGSAQSRYTTRKEALLAIVNAMAGICDEVANGKMNDPFTNLDSTLEESQFSHNSTTDFQNNMKGVLNVYMNKFETSGTGLHDYLLQRNLALDNKIMVQINTAILTFNSIDKHFGRAIFTQAVQIQNAQAALNDLKTTLETDLHDYIQNNIND